MVWKLDRQRAARQEEWALVLVVTAGWSSGVCAGISLLLSLASTGPHDWPAAPATSAHTSRHRPVRPWHHLEASREGGNDLGEGGMSRG